MKIRKSCTNLFYCKKNMQYLFEYTDRMNSPYEAFVFDASKQVFPVRPHWHYFTEIIYMTEGRVMIECDGVTYVLEKGDMIVLYPESVHAIYAVTGYPIVYEVLKFDINKLHAPNSYTPRLGKILQAARLSKKTQIVFRDENIQQLELKDYFDSCIKEISNHNYGYDCIIHNLIANLLIEIIRLWNAEGFVGEISTGSIDSSESIQSITAYIDEHSGENIKVENLASRCGMSYSFFAKNFHDLYGRSCKEYIELMRITKAADMLLFSSHSLSWIAQETGFSDSSHLIKTFRRWKNCTPKQFRQQQNVNSSIKLDN